MDMNDYQDEGMERLSLLLSIKRLKKENSIGEGLWQITSRHGDRQKEYRRLAVGALKSGIEDI